MKRYRIVKETHYDGNKEDWHCYRIQKRIRFLWITWGWKTTGWEWVGQWYEHSYDTIEEAQEQIRQWEQKYYTITEA